MDVRPLQATRAGRHGVHRAAQEASDLPALVSPHHRAAVHLVLVYGVHLLGALVCRHELLCA